MEGESRGEEGWREKVGGLEGESRGVGGRK